MPSQAPELFCAIPFKTIGKGQGRLSLKNEEQKKLTTLHLQALHRSCLPQVLFGTL